MVQTISTDIHGRVEDCHYIELMVCFYSTMKDSKVCELFIVMPVWWTPQLYLGVLHSSLSRNPVLSMEPITLDSKKYMTIYKIHWLYSDGMAPASKRELFKMLQSAEAFVSVCGGTLNGKTQKYW